MIRQATTKDVDFINELGFLYDSNFDKHFIINDYIEDHNYLINVVETNNVIIGFIICTRIVDEMEIHLIYIADDYRRLGYASSLISSVITDDAKRILLEVSKENNPAIKLYQKEGFNIINIRKKYYNGVDALVMEKVIK